MVKSINAKLQLPKPPPGCVPRARLIAPLWQSLGLNATLITAGAGWGKTVLAADFARLIGPRGWQVVWYSLGRDDQPMAVFFRHLVQAFQTVQADFGRNTRALLAAEVTDCNPVRLTDSLLFDLTEQIDRPTAVFLDNLTYALRTEWGGAVFNRLLPLLPAPLHFQLIARGTWGFTFSRLKAKQMLATIDAPMLAFTPGEAAALLTPPDKRSLTAAEIQLLLEHTRGRPSLLQLFCRGPLPGELETAPVGGSGANAASRRPDRGGGQRLY